MKNLMKSYLIMLLTLQMRVILYRFKPQIIAVTGSVGKTSTKEAIYSVLRNYFSTARSPKSYNSEIGVPLTVIGEVSAFNSIFGWIHVVWSGVKRVFARHFPDVLVLEAGVDRPGDMDKFLQYARPHIAVVTAIGEVPVHVEFFSSTDAVAKEKAKILRFLTAQDYAILNYDDETVRSMETKTKANVITYGFSDKAIIRASNYKLTSVRHEGREMPEGITFKVEYQGHTVPMRLKGGFGRQQVYSALAAIAVGVAKGLNLVEISEALLSYEAPPGRLKLIEGEKNSWILDDTYNASPLAVHAALDTLHDMSARRRVCVLGDMLELGKFTIPAHKRVGEQARNVCDKLIVVGTRAKFIAEEAVAKGMATERIHYAANSVEGGIILEEMLREEDAVLVKGSQGMRMEKVIEEVMRYPEEKERLLVRQEPFWTGEKVSYKSDYVRVGSLLSAAVGIFFFFYIWPIGVLLIALGAFGLFRLR